MKSNQNLLTKIIAIAGSVLVWLPILSPIFFSLALLFRAGIFRFDFLMPAELFPFVLVGSLLLLWAALRAHNYAKWLGFSLLIGIIFLVGSQLLAEVTGLASGRIPASGLPWILVLTMLGIYVLVVILIGVLAALLLTKIFRVNDKSQVL